MKQRGFIAFLLGNPMILACVAMGVILVGMSIAAKAYKAQRDSARGEVIVKESQLEAVRQLGKQAEIAAREQELKQKETTSAIQKTHQAQLARLRAELIGLRERPRNPSGGEIRIAAECPGKSDAVPEKLVPLADYVSLQERAAEDALNLVSLQDWVRGQGFPVE